MREIDKDLINLLNQHPDQSSKGTRLFWKLFPKPIFRMVEKKYFAITTYFTRIFKCLSFFSLLIGQLWKACTINFLFVRRIIHGSLNVYNTKKSRENIGSATLPLMSDRHKLRHASHVRTPVGYPLRYRESLKRFEKFLLPKRGGSFLEGFPTLLKNFRCLPVFRFF